MALVAPVEDGKIVESASQSSLRNTSKSSGNDMDKDAFLQLLVAQMKYQDPLQPTSNTEYISQYAQFSQVEQMQNMATSVDLQRASGLVGQDVYMKTTSSTGETRYVQGKVDYVVYENNKAYLSINEELYALEDLDTIADSTYLGAYNKALAFVEKMEKLPVVNGVDMRDAVTIDALEKEYNEMTEYEKSFLASDVVETLEAYVDKMKEVRAAAENSGKADSEEESSEETSGEENTDGAGSETGV